MIPAFKRVKTVHALERAATLSGTDLNTNYKKEGKTENTDTTRGRQHMEL
jgi:hypothetical protein